MRRFADRTEAGRALAEAVSGRPCPEPLVLALPRGGVPLGVEIARALAAPLDLVMVRKVGVPGQPELAAAAVVDGTPPEIVVNDEVAAAARLDEAEIARLAERELAEIARRRTRYLAGRRPIPVEGRCAIVVDDGIATGATVRAALKGLRRRRPARLALAVPLAPAETLDALATEVDDVVCLRTPSPFRAIGAHYEDFTQVSDEEVVRSLAAAAAAVRSGTASGNDGS